MRNTGIVKAFAHLKIFLGTGQGWIADFKYPILLAIALKVYFPSASLFTMGAIVLSILILIALLGWFDLRFLKVSQTTAEISTRKYNPYFSDLEKSIARKGLNKS